MIHSVNFFQKLLGNIYAQKNMENGFDYLYGYLVKNYYRPRHECDIDHIFIKSMSYLMAISTLYDIDLLDAYKHKYPGVCPYCFAAPCICVLTNKTSHLRLTTKQETEELDHRYSTLYGEGATPITFEDAFRLINKIYPGNKVEWIHHGSRYHMVKTGEELGELHEACCRYEKYANSSAAQKGIEDEIADVFVWILSEWGLRKNGQGMTDSFKEYYSSNCSKCKHIPCTCGKREDHDTLLVAQTFLLKTEQLFTSLIEDEELCSTLSEQYLNAQRECILQEKTEKSVTSAIIEVLEDLNQRLRRIEIQQQKRQRILDEIALIQESITARGTIEFERRL